MSNQKPIVKHLKDYRKPEFLISKTKLNFIILDDKIVVKSELILHKNSETNELTLNGEDLVTKAIYLNDQLLIEGKDYNVNDSALVIHSIDLETFVLQTEVEIDPYNNTKLMGIYKSNSCIASQCEPEGFRRITWFIDRPDVMSLWNVSISARNSDFETLLSNGNLVSDTNEGELRTCVFDDPFPKPSYLFAFVAGNFDIYSDVFITKSSKSVNLNIFVEKGKKEQAKFALESLKRSMKWDEDTFNLIYELEVFSIVAVSDFNFGAMENKSLNIFNETYVLADPYIATDDDFFNIESIVAHEYFHNFTGNRITCRDWFQLTLKEGLTVFRDHIFSEDLRHRDVVRINDVEVLRNHQFHEDNGPLCHPIRPISYIEMNNFYTTTVYEKGSEVIRMIQTIIGADNFKRGIDTYFENFDGQAVTCEDFLWAMEKASGISLEKFKQWYFQSGTPIVEVYTNYDQASKKFKISLKQINNPTFDQKNKQDLVIPLRVALLDKNGNHLPLKIKGNQYGLEHVLVLEDNISDFVFDEIDNIPILSINRYFSAPIILNFDQSDEDLVVLMNHDNDGFIRFESAQKYFKKHMLDIIEDLEHSKEISKDKLINIVSPLKSILNNYSKDKYMTSVMLKLPTFSSLEMCYKNDLPIQSIVETINLVEEEIAVTYEDSLFGIFNSINDLEEEFSTDMMGKRSLKNRVIYYLLKTKKQKYLDMIVPYYKETKSMTKKIGVLLAIKDLINKKEHKEIFTSFYEEFKNHATVLNKWLSISASISHPDVIDNIKKLTELDTFSYNNPNKVRYLFGGFIANNLAFHNLDGSGYKLIENIIIKMDKMNPSISASLAKSFSKINLHNKQRKELMKSSMDRMLNEKISKGLYEILSKSVVENI